MLTGIVFAGSSDSSDFFSGSVKPTMLTTHPLGLLFTRIDHPFQNKPPRSLLFQLDIGTGNVWLPPTTSYFPKDPATLTQLLKVPWHKRDSVYNLLPRNHDSSLFEADGIIRSIFLKILFPLSKRLSASVQIRSFLITNGKPPFALLTSDAFIEEFHRSVAGGNNPFARNQYGYNKAAIYYQDKNGNYIKFHNNQFVLSGIQSDLFYYPELRWLKKHHASITTGLHTGVNTTTRMPLLDLGLSATFQKQSNPDKKNVCIFSLAGSFITRGVIHRKQELAFSNRKTIPSFETQLEWRRKNNSNKQNSLSLNFYFQSALNKPQDFDKLVLHGTRYTTHWHMGVTHMYRSTQNWTLTYAWFRKYVLLIYIKEDFKVDNAPDLQTGFAVLMPLATIFQHN
jgi:hypothetical protein